MERVEKSVVPLAKFRAEKTNWSFSLPGHISVYQTFLTSLKVANLFKVHYVVRDVKVGMKIIFDSDGVSVDGAGIRLLCVRMLEECIAEIKVFNHC